MQTIDPLLSMNRIADAFEHARGFIFALMVVVSLGAVYGFVHVPTAEQDEEAKAAQAAPQFDSADDSDDTEAPESNPAAELTPDELPPLPERRFETASTECLLVVEIDDVFTPAAAAGLRDVVAALEAMPQVARIFWLDSIPNLNMFGLSDPLLPNQSASAAHFAAAKQKAMQHPLAGGQLISQDGKTLLMPIWLNWVNITDDAMATDDVLQVARQAASKHAQSAPMRIRLTGRVPLYISAQEALNHNHLKFQIIGYTLVLVLAVILFRGVSAVVIVAGAPALGIFWSHGWLRLFDQLDNPLTGAVLPVLVSMVGFTDGVHLIVHIRAARAAGETAMEAAKSAIRKVGLACLLTSLTTAIGFGSLMLASNEYVQGFGQACAVGVLLTFVAVICFIPLASTTRLGRDIHKGHERDFVRNNLEKLSPLIDWVILRKLPLAIFSFLLTVGLLAWAYQNLRPDDRLSDSQPTGSEAYQALTHCDQAFGGIEAIEVRLYWSYSRRNEQAAILDAVAAAKQVIDDEPLVHHGLSIHEFLNQLPGSSNAIATSAYLALLPEAIQESYFSQRRRQAVITARIQDLGIATFEPVFSRIEEKLVKLEAEHEGFRFVLAGSPVRRGRELYRIVVDLTTSLGTASIIILVVMAIVYRSWTIGLITIVPNMFPLVVTAAFLILVGQPLEIASVCSFTVCLGIAVDDSIHFLSRYQDERRSGRDAVQAVRSTFIGVGTALITTTLVLIAGFGTVLTSDLPGHRTFASMACWTIGAALVGDLIFLPALLLCFDRDAKIASDSSDEDAS